MIHHALYHTRFPIQGTIDRAPTEPSRYILLLLILLLAAAFRFDALAQDKRFHADEAFFAAFARHAAVHGDWMLSGALDKTPLSLYASAVSMHLTGVYTNDKGVLDLDLRQGEFAARLPSVFAGIVLVALVYQLGGLYAALLTALSPFLTGYSASAFTDPLMLTFMVASVVAARHDRPAWSGVLLALSFASKQQGLLYLPLVGIVALMSKTDTINCVPTETESSVGTPFLASVYKNPIFICFHSFFLDTPYRLLRFTLPLISLIILTILWDSSRGGLSLFTLAAQHNNPERVFVRVDELLPRLVIWMQFTGGMFGAWWVTAGIVGMGVWGLWGGGRGKPRPYRNGFVEARSIVPCGILGRVGQGMTGHAPTVFLFMIYTLMYLLIHWIFAFNTYDRYVLPLIPLMAVMVGRGLERLAGRRTLAGLALLTLVMLPFARMGFPADNRSADDALLRLSQQLNSYPLGTIVYNHWLGWEMGYYYGAWSDKRPVYYPDPQTQADDALLNPDPAPRYFIAPADAAYQAWITAFRANGFTVRQVDAPAAFVVFEVIPFWGGAASESSSPDQVSGGGE